LVAQFEIYTDIAGKWRWRFKSAGNYKIVADSGESYDSRQGCENGVKIVKTQVANAKIEYL